MIKSPRKPDHSRDGQSIYLAKCEHVLPSLPADSVDGVVTDPPFGIGFKYDEHNDNMTPEEYGKWLWAILTECERICKPGAPIFVYQAMPNCRYFSEWFPRDYRIFAGIKNFAQIYPEPMRHSYDPVIVWWKEGGEKPYSAGLVHGKVCRDFHVAKTSLTMPKTWLIEREHPSPRPLDQIEYIVSTWVKPNGVVLDPFLGSATTMIACMKTRRKCIGIEKSKNYFDICVKRVEDEAGANTLTEFRKRLKEKGSHITDS